MQPYECQYVGSYYDEQFLQNGRLEIGGDYPLQRYFHGYMRKLKFYDWPQKWMSVK